MTKSKTIPLFVYGTLKKGGIYHYLLGDSKFVRKASVEGFTLYTNNGRWPMARPNKGSHINGELWLVNENVFDRVASVELGAGYDMCTVDGKFVFFPVMNDEFWKLVEQRSVLFYKVGPNWPIHGDYKRWEKLANEKYGKKE